MEKQEMLALLTSMARGIAKTFGKNCETLIQDLDRADHPILAIFNGHVTGRGPGSVEDVFGSTSKGIEPALLQRDLVNMMVVRGEQRIKSTTMIVRGEGYCLGLGINLDVTLMGAYAEFLSGQLETDSYLDSTIDSAKEVRLAEIFDLCQQEAGVPPEEMKKEDRLVLIRLLKAHHAFDYQKAVPFISERLGVSRYTVYNYLKEVEKPVQGKPGPQVTG